MIYKINMSKGDAILIDEADLVKIKENIKSPLIQVKQGIINPSFMISIIPDESKKEFIEKQKFEIKGDTVYVTGYEKNPTLEDIMNKKLS